MTVNSLNLNTSVPFTGLATQTLNIPTTGLYTFGVKADIPWITSDQPQATANPQATEVQNITCAADTAGSRNNTYFTFYSSGNVAGFYVWFNINSAGTDPAVAGLTGIEVDGATGATASTLGGAVRTAIAANASAASYFAVSGATTHVILTNKTPGSCTAAANGAGGASAGASFSITTTGSYGYGSGLQILVKNGSTVLMNLSQPTPNQKSMGGSVVSQCTAADVITVVTQSLAAVDALPNAIKGVINIFAGE